MTIYNRLIAPTPKLFQNIRNIGLTIATIGGIIISAPIALPAILITIGGYLTVAGGVISAVSQLTINDNATNDEQ
ncbi:hypothetical protein [Faecalibacter rhinopitheci]|uniref:Uncharacterized protein n=1 Tax=Faecalibacter rhinopitheci TaxID=2779678 RepID=A0A8J7KAZ1_9FLAO|nr:hypothetical protein [Faecalibacter rhinopitheci]MBF0598045.1 hypothetical protein [Faecalibacter rhinopitheci]